MSDNMKKVNGQVYYSGTSAGPITTRLNIYEVKNGRPDYVTQAEFSKALGEKSIGKGLSRIKSCILNNGLTTASIYFEDKKKMFVFTYYNSFSYFNRERNDLLTKPNAHTLVDRFKKGLIYNINEKIV